MSLTARGGPIPGVWQYNLNDGTDNRAGRGRIAGKTDHLEVLRYAAGICVAGYQPGTVERGLLEQFASTPAVGFPGLRACFTPTAHPGADDRTARNERTSRAASADTLAI